MQEPAKHESGQIWMLADNPREPELVFDFPFDEELNEAVRELLMLYLPLSMKNVFASDHTRIIQYLRVNM